MGNVAIFPATKYNKELVQLVQPKPTFLAFTSKLQCSWTPHRDFNMSVSLVDVLYVKKKNNKNTILFLFVHKSRWGHQNQPLLIKNNNINTVKCAGMLVPIFMKCSFTPMQQISGDSSTNQSEPSACRGKPSAAVVVRTYPIKDGDSRQIARKGEMSPSRLQEMRQRDGEAKKTL